MENDPRYYDLASRLDEADCDWDQVLDYLNLWSLHPFCPMSEQANQTPSHLASDLVREYGTGIELWTGPRSKQSRELTVPEFFRVHVGAVELMCEYLGLRKITAHEAVVENIQKMTKPYNLPKFDRSPEQFDRILDQCKQLFSAALKEPVKREADRMKMIALVFDNHQAVLKNLS